MSEDFFNFGDAPTEQFGGGELIPDGVLAWAIVTVRPASPAQIEKPSKSTEGNAYLDLELTIAEGPYTRRRVWDILGVKGSEAYVNQGRAAIRAMLEAGRNAGPGANAAGYKIGGFMDLNGLRVAIKISIEKGANGYADKNRVAAYLSPNPESSSHKAWGLLLAGKTEAAPSATAAPAWGGATTAAPAPAAPDATGAPAWLQS